VSERVAPGLLDELMEVGGPHEGVVPSSNPREDATTKKADKDATQAALLGPDQGPYPVPIWYNMYMVRGLQDQLVCLKVLNLITQDTDEDRSNKHSTTKTSRRSTTFVAVHWTTQRCRLFLRDKYEVYIAMCQGTENCERLVASC